MTKKHTTATTSDATWKGIVLDPEDVKIPGVDFEIEVDHPLYKPRIPVIARILAERGQEGLDELVADVFRSLKTVGRLLHPVLCRSNGGVIECGIGTRRLLGLRRYNRWAREEGHDPIMARLSIEAWSENQWRAAIIAENEARRDDDMIDAIDAVVRYVAACGSEASAARVMGMSSAELRTVLRINTMTDSAKALCREHHIGRDVAATLAQLSSERQAPAIRQLAASQRLTIAAAREFVLRENESKKPGKEPAKPRGPKPPPRPLIRNIAKVLGSAKIPMHPQAAALLEWVRTGTPESAAKVNGLSEALRVIEEARAAKSKGGETAEATPEAAV